MKKLKMNWRKKTAAEIEADRLENMRPRTKREVERQKKAEKWICEWWKEIHKRHF